MEREETIIKNEPESLEDFRKYRLRLAGEIMSYVRDQLVVAMPFFNRAILKMPVVFYDQMDAGDGSELEKGFGTDGTAIYCNQDLVLFWFRQRKEKIARIYLHLMFHCLYSHPFRYETLNRVYWDFAADVAVEHTILELKHKECELPDDDDRRLAIKKIHARTNALTAEGIYHHLYLHPEEADEIMTDRDLFFMDLHGFWLPDELLKRRRYDKNPHPGVNKVSQDWKKLGQSVKLDLQVFEKNQGLAPGSLSENLREVARDQYDYSEFLRKFAVTHEEMHINDEEFDYIYYNYGLELYGNLPLIEPLEYRESKKIHDFVIAIDTSGSCQGRTVRNFLSRTYSILKSTESFFREVNIHIIQCDAKIQEDVCIHSDEEFEAYMKEMKIRGFGGTDFRPVFAHVDQMIRDREFSDLKGLIYFTDGMGTFPERMPSYRTAFVFVEDPSRIPKLPAWAIRLVLKDEDFDEYDWQEAILRGDYDSVPNSFF